MAIELVIAAIIILQASSLFLKISISIEQIIFEGIFVSAVGLIFLLLTKNLHTKLTGNFYDYFPIEPIDIMFVGFLVSLSAATLFFIQLDAQQALSKLAIILPWTLAGQYRGLHELFWMIKYWSSQNVLNKKFSNKIKRVFSNKTFYPALSTHFHAAAFTIYFIINIYIIFNLFG